MSILVIEAWLPGISATFSPRLQEFAESSSAAIANRISDNVFIRHFFCKESECYPFNMRFNRLIYKDASGGILSAFFFYRQNTRYPLKLKSYCF